MGLPARAVLGNGKAVESNAEVASPLPEPSNAGDDAAQILEEKARKALECPCVADLRDGPCGQEFSRAFTCFVKSQEPEKGSDCVNSFEEMQKCMLANTRSFTTSDHLAPPPKIQGGHRKPTDNEDEESEDESDTAISKSVYGGSEVHPRTDVHPPRVPENSIRLPLWYTEKFDAPNVD